MKKINRNKIKLDNQDVINLFINIWYEKRTVLIITLLSVILGLFFLFSQPKKYQVTKHISLSSDSYFIKYKRLNEALITQKLDTFLINKSHFDRIIQNKFKDYNYIYDVLKKNNLENLDIKIDEDTKKKLLKNLSSSFSSISKNKINFIWNNAQEGEILLNYALYEILNSVKNLIINDLKIIKDFISNKNKSLIEEANKDLKDTIISEKSLINQTISFLNNQADIARELKIEFNQEQLNSLNKFFDKRFDNTNTTNFSLFYDINYYLKGFMPIELEINILKQLLNDNNFLFSNRYAQKQEKVKTLQNDKDYFDNLFSEYMLIIENDDPLNWIGYDTKINQKIDLRRSKIFVIIFSLLTGLGIGSLYVLVANEVKSRKYNII